jgi:hypothetical protein
LPRSTNPISTSPIYVAYSQHYYGEKKSWSEVSKEGSHPKVYIEKGGHPSLFTGGSEYSIRWDYGCDYGLVLLQNQKWLKFRGVWGATTGLTPSPPGPVFRHSQSTALNPLTPVSYMWIDPIYWSDTVC